MLNRLARRNGGPVGLIALIAILLLALGLRVGEAWDERPPVYDAAAYAAIAADLEQGEGFTVGPAATQPSSNYSPGLPLFVAGLYKLSGGVHERLARLVLAALGALGALLAYLLGRRLARVADCAPHSELNSPHVLPGLVGAGVVAVYPALLEYQGMLMSEPLAATLLVGAVLAVLWADDGRRSDPAGGSLLRWVVPGLLLGALALVRPEYLGVAASVVVLVAARAVRIDPRRALTSGAVLLLGIVMVVAPWTVRNALALDRFVPISTGGGQVLYAGTYLPSDGNPERVGPEVVAHNPDLFAADAAERLRLEQILARLAAREYPDLEADRALSRLGKEQLWEDLSREPLRYAGFVATKVGRVWSHGPRQIMRAPVWEALHWALVALGLLGLAVLARMRRWEALLIGLVFLAITAVSALLVASPRRVLVLVPLLAPLASIGAAWLRRLPSRGRT